METFVDVADVVNIDCYFPNLAVPNSTTTSRFDVDSLL
jgi:hypothetical protein